jgi:uncharacterized protein YqjF (DUF2071 family)
MLHYEVEAGALQQVVPFELDLCAGSAYVSLVAFTLSGMRPRFGGALLGWMLRPIATHDFLNVRTYVRCRRETGIYFLAEWLANRLSVMLGPPVFGLPYRYGRIKYYHDHDRQMLAGRVADRCGPAFEYRGTVDEHDAPRACERGSLTEALMERYTAFTRVNGKARFFRVWHLPWQQQRAEITVTDQSLLESNWIFFREARFVGANYSRGLEDVWMGWPHPLTAL